MRKNDEIYLNDGLYLLFLWLFSMMGLVLIISSCTKKQSEVEITTLTDKKALEKREGVKKQVSVELADGFDLQLWAPEQLLEDPVGLDIDNQGNAYVSITNRRKTSELGIRDHKKWMIPSISFDEIDDRKNFLHQELAPQNSDSNTWLADRNEDGSHDWQDLTVQKEEIYRIEDRSGDGMADLSQLYIRDFHSEVTDVAGAVLSYNDEVFVGVAPDLWRLKDKSDDGMANSKTSISHGYKVHIGFSGHGMSGLTMGPDGRIYWAIGDTGLNVVGPDGKKWYYPNQGAIMRSNPDGSDFEVFAAGVRNTHEFSFDKYGNLITVDNDGDHAGEFERLVYLINGSDSGWRSTWQFGKYTDPKNNDYNVWMDENYFKPRFKGQAAHLLPPLAAFHDGPSGMAYNPGTALSGQWKDHFFVAGFTGSPSRSAIYAFSLDPKGASFELQDDQSVMEGILATSLDFGPDGALYFADWIEGWSTDDKGRIWKLDTPGARDNALRKKTKQLLAESFESHSSEQLLQLMQNEDMRVRMKAQFELVDRGEKKTLLAAVEQTQNQLTRLHGIWGIGQLGREDITSVEVLTPYLTDPDPQIRAQTAKVLGDVRYEPSAETLVSLLEDENPRVQLFAAQALGRMANHGAVQPIIDMLEENNDEDVYLRQAGAIALARIGDDESLVDCADHPSKAVRIAAVVALGRMGDPGVAAFLNDEDEFIVTSAARAINDDVFIKEALPELARMLDQNKFMNEPLLRRAINANLFDGTSADAERIAAFAAREDAPKNMRVEALATLGVWADPSVLDRVTGRFRGKIQHDIATARKAIAPVMNTLLTKETATVKTAAAQTVGKLAYKPAFATLLALLKEDEPAEVKIAALKALKKGGSDHIEDAAKVALNASQRRVRMAALGMIPQLKLAEERMVNLLSSVLEGGAIVEQQRVLEALGEIQNKAAYQVLGNQLDKLIEDELMAEIQLDLIMAVKNNNSKTLKDKLKKYESAKSNHDSVAVFQESLKGGVAERGKNIFYQDEAAQCQRCHAIEGGGGEVGPNLNTIGIRLNRRQLLQALVDPTARIAPGYGTVTVRLKNGNTMHGMLSEEKNSYLMLKNGDQKVQKVLKKDIIERTNDPSAMPPMGHILSRKELRDMVEFLSTRTEK